MHARKLIRHVTDRGGQATLGAIAAPRCEFTSPLDAANAVRDLERATTESIHRLYELARKEGDHALEVLLQWYVTEQVEEEQWSGELATLTNPGPFGIRTPELGEYFGYFDGERLIAMAGERMEVANLREISGICTHPDVQGRGLARKLTLKLVRREMQRGLTPYLHVLSHNTGARTLYTKMGFRDYLETVVRVVTRL